MCASGSDCLQQLHTALHIKTSGQTGRETRQDENPTVQSSMGCTVTLVHSIVHSSSTHTHTQLTFATLRRSITFVCGHCISCQLTATIGAPARLFACTTPRLLSAVVR